MGGCALPLELSIHVTGKKKRAPNAFASGARENCGSCKAYTRCFRVARTSRPKPPGTVVLCSVAGSNKGSLWMHRYYITCGWRVSSFEFYLFDGCG